MAFLRMPSLAEAAKLVLAGIAVYNVASAVYNVFFHPLRRYPGPLLGRASRIPHALSRLRGTLLRDMLALHRKYGDVVRYGPEDLSFTDPAAWKDVYGHRPGNGEHEELPKFVLFERILSSRPHSIMTADTRHHAVLRKGLAASFSEKGMREQEPLIQKYVDMLVAGLRKHSAPAPGSDQPRAVDMTGWYNWTTFDIIGELVFADPWGCLENAAWSPWVTSLVASIHQFVTMEALVYLGFGALALAVMLPNAKGYMDNQKLTQLKLRKRLELGAPRPDLLEVMLQNREKWGLNEEMLEMNSLTLFIAGSETTATLLCGVTYLLGSNPAALERVTREVRSGFKSEAEIDLMSVNKLTYLLACLDEAMRMFPPAPVVLPRIVPKGGTQICGQYVAEGTVVAVYGYAVNYQEKYFADPYNYHPERFLGDERFKDDQLDALQPFHVGRRDCIGRTLAYAEMRLIMAKILWNFDMRLKEDAGDWIQKQKVFTFWDKPPLNVYFTPVKR